MSTLHSSNRYYHPREFQDQPRGLVLPVWVGVGIVGLAAYAGMQFGGWTERQVTPKPEIRIVSARTPLTQWQCTRQEFAEYREACARRATSALIKPPKE